MLFQYTSTNPCNCGYSPTIISDPGCDDACNCLEFCSISIPSNSDEAVAPCGGELILNVLSSEYEHNTCACGEDPLSVYLAYYDETVFDPETASLTTTGDLNLTTLDNTDVLHSNVIIRGVCGKLSAYLTIVVGIQDMCALITCPPGETCDACTGICEPIIDAGVS